MRVFAKTDKGKERDINEDFYYVSKEPKSMQICVLADGMGGYNGGEVASRLATECAKKYILENFDKIEHNEEEIQNLVKGSIEYANNMVNEKALKEEELEQMGTTLEICLIYNNKIYIGHIGDSRIYRIRKKTIEKITTDHSYVEKLVRDGTITREEAVYHPKKHMLIKAIGAGLAIEPDLLVDAFSQNDIIMMCSDGLSNMISEDEMLNIITENTELATDRLIEKANSLGGYDNISVILIENN